MKKNTEKLSEDAYRVTQQSVTEPPFSGALLKEDRNGIYHCVVCKQPLFSSEKKFDSGSGWPSFTTAVDTQVITLQPDNSLGTERTEVRCGRCDAHLGHVFADGPKTLPDGSPASGQRFCINSCALNFSADKNNEK